MLDAITLDLLVIATPPSAHLGEMTAAAARDVHVLCEKPLGLTDDDVATLRDLARGHPHLALSTVHQYRFASPWRWIARAVAGALRTDEPFRLTAEVERPGTDPLSAGGWRTDPEHEGGILGDHAIHYLALLEMLDPACEVISCYRDGPGGREVASLEVRLGAAGVGRVDVSYAGSRRGNGMLLARPAQCLDVDWRDATLTVLHDGRPGAVRSVESLSNRTVVNALYSPMYEELLTGLDDPSWRLQATGHTIGSAALLASAIRLAR